MTEEGKIQLITGGKAENLMLYPMQKWDYAEPLLELLVEIKRLLESETCKFLIVVGYSFRDDHIRRILWDAARKNRELHLILIGPKAYQIYFEKLKYYLAKYLVNKGKIEFESYIKLRQDKIPNIEQFRKEYEMLQKYSQLRNLDSIIIEVEKSILKEIIKKD